ncbi:uncharacterized protein LOC131674449 [Phymastichus coffea]|uniref:uncharacterized protein LOC131674449 n=1 Tax=Phymastichus coffea TaxID=108790 RepID=UPI00273B48B2|nr:uncharacterized protein LOC131674449 [Phymastichus coffea]
MPPKMRGTESLKPTQSLRLLQQDLGGLNDRINLTAQTHNLNTTQIQNTTYTLKPVNSQSLFANHNKKIKLSHSHQSSNISLTQNTYRQPAQTQKNTSFTQHVRNTQPAQSNTSLTSTSLSFTHAINQQQLQHHDLVPFTTLTRQPSFSVNVTRPEPADEWTDKQTVLEILRELQQNVQKVMESQKDLQKIRDTQE